jgi:hypothetical protein
MNMRKVLSAMLLLLLVLAAGYSSAAAQSLTSEAVTAAAPAGDGDEAYTTGHQKLPAGYSQYVRCVNAPGASLRYRLAHAGQRAVRCGEEAYTTGHQKLPPSPPCMRNIMIQ